MYDNLCSVTKGPGLDHLVTEEKENFKKNSRVGKTGGVISTNYPSR